MTFYLLLALAMHLNSDFRSDHTIYSAKSVFYVDWNMLQTSKKLAIHSMFSYPNTKLNIF